MNEVMSVAYTKACEAAKAIEGFAADHPLATAVFCTIIALGVLVVLTPFVLEALGFASLGPVEGKYYYHKELVVSSARTNAKRERRAD